MPEGMRRILWSESNSEQIIMQDLDAKLTSVYGFYLLAKVPPGIESNIACRPKILIFHSSFSVGQIVVYYSTYMCFVRQSAR